MKAAVCHESGKPLVIEEVELDPPRKRQVRVRLAAVSTCYCDLHMIRGHWGRPLPMVAGHEAAGVVEEVGEDVTQLTPGVPVVVSAIRSCGKCLDCVAGRSHLCAQQSFGDDENKLRDLRGAPLNRGAQTAAFAEQVVVDESQVVRVPDEMPLDRAALLGCTVITGVGAVVNTARVKPASSVVVIGAGAIGLNVVQGAALVGAHPIVAVDLDEDRLTLARTFGATHTLKTGHSDAAETDTAEAVAQLTAGGADYVFVTLGKPEAIEMGFRMLGRRGTEVVVGFAVGLKSASFPINALVAGEKKVMGSSMGSTRLSAGVPWLANLYLRGGLKLDQLISGRYPLERINDALEALERGAALRNVVQLQQLD